MPGVVGDEVELGGQQRALGLQALHIGSQVAAERQRALGATLAALDGHGDVGLLHAGGLAQGTLVETQEVAGFGAQVQRAAVERRVGLQQRRGQGLEVFGLQVGQGRAHAAAPNTSTPVKRQAGDACPTRMTCDGSPLPQYGEPPTTTVSGPPTPARLRQKVALTPR